MKTKLPLLNTIYCFLFLLALCPSPCALSQVPKGFNYQAIVRDGTTKQPIISQSILVRITIENAAETVVYRETHSLSTDEFGIMAIVIGDGTPVGTALFSDIDWNEEPLFIKTELQYPVGGSYTEMGTAPLLSVPYAMVADSLSAPLTKLTVKGETTDMEEALFEVRNKDGQIIFAVYNEGVRVYVSDGDKKGPKGGFAIGGFGGDKQGVQKYFFVSGDSIRAYIDSTSTKAVKGGFAIGGFEQTKAPGQEYLRITDDSTRIYINDNPGKSVKGGFAIGGFENNKGTVTPFTSLTPENYFIGHQSGKDITTGQYNSFLGYQTGVFNSTGSGNSFMGYQSGFNSNGSGNLFLGYQSGFSNTVGDYNTFLGYLSGYHNTTGLENTFLGSFTGNFNSSGRDNTFIGYYAGYNNTDGVGNIFAGTRSGYNNLGGNHNLFIGTQSGQANTTGNYNIFLGYQSGNNNKGGADNTFIGKLSGFTNTSGGSNVFMGNSAGYTNNASNNVFIGFESGYTNSSGTLNAFMGYKAGRSTSSGYSNVFIGNQAGYTNTENYSNVYIGDQAGYSNQGNWNTMIGYKAGMNTTGGASNVFLGNEAGLNNVASGNVYIGYWAGKANNVSDGQNVFIGRSAGENYKGWQSVVIGPMAGYNGGGASTGIRNVFLGFSAGYSETGNYRLHIASGSSSATESLIYGEFDNKILVVNGKLYAGSYSGGGVAGVNAYSLELGGPSPTGTNGEATLFLHDHLTIAHQLRYTNGTLFLEAAGNGYGTSTTPALWIGGGLYAGINGGYVGIGTSSPSERLEVGGANSRIYMNSTSSNMINFNINGVAAPSLSSRSAGTKIVLYPAISASLTDYALGIESQTMWFSVPSSSQAYKFYSGTTELIRIQGDGKVGIGTTSPQSFLEIVAPGNSLRLTRSGTSNYFDLGIGAEGYLKVNNQSLSGAYCTGATWTNGSDRNLKENFIYVDGSEILAKLDELPVTSWNYKGDGDGIKHIGPVAQDFYRIFGLGNDDKSISTIDPAGISLLAIKELNRINQAQQQQIESLNEKVAKLEQLVDKMMEEK